MALSRLNEFNDGTALTETKQEGEFDNIYNNPTALVSPWTANQDADGNQLISQVIEKGTSNPGSELNEGRIFYRTDMNQLLTYDGSNWVGAGPTVYLLTNKSGGSLAAGDVVIVDSSTASSVTTTTTEASTDLPMVCLETINNDADGLFILSGRTGALTVDGSTSIGAFLKTSSTLKKATSTSSFETGVFAIALTSSSTSVAAIIFGPNKVSAIDNVINTYNMVKNSSFEYWSAGTSSAPDGWTLAGAGASIARNGATIKAGTYSAAVTRGGADTTLTQNIAAISPNFSLNYFDGRAITFSAWVSASVSSTTRLGIADGVGTTNSSYHTGGGGFEYLTVTRSTCLLRGKR